MARYFIELSYDGALFGGFQIQQNVATVQGALENAMETLFRTAIPLTGASRTDAGVHAYQNFLHFDTDLEILPKHILENEDINSTFFSRKPTGSNYYKLGDWVSGQQVNLIKSENGVLGAAYIKRLTSRIIPDTSSQFLELSAGNIDLMNINPIQFKRVFPAKPKLKNRTALYKEMGNGYTYLGFNLKREPFNDKKVRQAINYAINKDEVIKGVLLGLGEPISSPYKPGTRWSDPSLKPYEYSPKKALNLLKEAGYKMSDDNFLVKDGKALEFEIITNQNKQREMTAVLIQRRLKEIGIKVSIRVIEWASFVNRFIKPGDFDVVVLGWSLSLDPDQFNIWHSSQQGPGQFNFVGYDNKKVDQLLEKGRRELDLDKRKVTLSIKLLEEIEKKEALDKYGSEGSGKNLPFSSLSEDLKKKEEDKE